MTVFLSRLCREYGRLLRMQRGNWKTQGTFYLIVDLINVRAENTCLMKNMEESSFRAWAN